MINSNTIDYVPLAQKIKEWGIELGFQQIAITDTHLEVHSQNLKLWLDKGFHGSMSYMEKHADLRSDPTLLMPNTQRIIMARMDYLPPHADIVPVLKDKNRGAISRYALGKDYHKIIRKRLSILAKKISDEIGPFQYRPFADSAPIMEKPLAEKAGLGWIGKHTVLLNRHAGSWFFLGALLIDLPLPIDTPVKNHCGSCSACIDICPTQAIIGPKQLDARRCISYLTIEHKGSIPIEFRSLMGNRIYGCDDCQLVCPWNRYAKTTQELKFYANDELKNPKLLDLFAWSEAEFMTKTIGSAMRRVGYEGWLRNIAIALGNAPYHASIVKVLKGKLDYPSALVQEHVAWGIEQQLKKS